MVHTVLCCCKRGRSPSQEQGVSRLLSRFLVDESAATSIEYAIIAVGLSIVILTAVQLVGTNLNKHYEALATATTAK
jgi:pilus assembly protein Flp/PilA